jgi:PTH1 family peptidyl-tRNA hydrolase
MLDDTGGRFETQRYLIVGLGNPGREHRHNRHNLGFMAIDRLAARHGVSLGRAQQKAIIGAGPVAGRSTVLAKPQTWMNHSGESVAALVRFYKISPPHLLVVYDELDIPFGALRLRAKGSAGGHNGMRSIIHHLGPEFSRLRLGIGRPPGRLPAAAYVLQDFSREELPVVEDMLTASLNVIETFLRDGIDAAVARAATAGRDDQAGKQPEG